MYLAFEVFQDTGTPIRKIQVKTEVLPCLVPSWPQIMQIRLSFRSRSDLVLDADHALDLTNPISFVRRRASRICSVSDRSGASLFLPCSSSWSAVAHM